MPKNPLILEIGDEGDEESGWETASDEDGLADIAEEGIDERNNGPASTSGTGGTHLDFLVYRMYKNLFHVSSLANTCMLTFHSGMMWVISL